MNAPSPLVDRRLAKQMVLAQLCMIPVLSLLAYLMFGAIAAYSLCLGAAVGGLGSAYFAWQSFRHAGANASKRILSGFYRGMTGKFVITLIGFLVVFRVVRSVSALAVFAGFALIQITAWVYPLWFERRYGSRSF